MDDGDGQSTLSGVTKLSAVTRRSVKSSLKQDEEELVERLLAMDFDDDVSAGAIDA